MAYPVIYRVSNGGVVTRRPKVTEVKFFADQQCSHPVSIPTNGGWSSSPSSCASTGCDLCSNWMSDYGGTVGTTGCGVAIDGR